MATVGVVNGHFLRFFVGGVSIAKATECTISFAAATREIAHKDTASSLTGGWREVLPGQLSGTGSTSGLYAEDTNSFATLYDSMVAGDTLAITFTTGESGDSVWYADAIITSMELSAPNDENVTYSISFEFSGEVVRS